MRFVDSVNTSTLVTTAPRHTVSAEDIHKLQFPKLPFLRKTVPAPWMEGDVFQKIHLYNSSDSVRTFYFLPAFYLNELQVFRLSPDSGKMESIPRIINSELPGSVLLTMNAGDSAIYFTKFRFVRTNVNNYLPRIIEKDYVSQFKAGMKSRDAALDMITFIASGILLLMIFYSMAAYTQSRNLEFIFYSVYTLCTAILLFLKSFFNIDSGPFHFFYEEYLDFMILGLGVFFYLFFLRTFLNSRVNYPFLDKFLRGADITLLVLLSIYSMLYFLTEKYIILNVLENYVIKLFLFTIGIVFIIYSLRKNHRLLNYLAVGNLALLVFSIISLGVIILKWQFSDNVASIFNRAMFYYILGLVLELLCFLGGLAYKNKKDITEKAMESERLRLDNERKELEKQVAVMAAQKDERDRISADMHDELGSGVTAIRLMSEIVKSKMKETSLPEIDKISNSANDLLGKMDTIIWTMKSSNDTLESLIAYIRAYAKEYFENTSITCKVQVQPLPAVQISGEKRRNIFLGIKEALHNIVKHAQATEVRINVEATGHMLTIEIADNGIGLDPDKQRKFGNGLNNMKRRMESIEGSWEIISSQGTKVVFRLPV
jgi:signal transduction histidine kinase